MSSLRRRRQLVFSENIEWLSSPENHGLYLPFNKLFVPRLSKSAPCKCCASLSNTCADCNSKLPAIKITDSVYGGPFSFISGTATNTSASVWGAADCAHPTTLSTVTTTISYVMGCHSGTPPYYRVDATYWWCNGTSLATNSAQGSNIVGSSHVNVVNLDCVNPNFSFTMSPPAGTVSPWNIYLGGGHAGGTFTVAP